MTRFIVLCTAALVAVAGCARTREPALSADHPASPQAAEAPPPKISATLKTPSGQLPAPPTDAAASPGDTPAGAEAFTCPHHPAVIVAERGECPRCGMKLVPTQSRQTSPLRAAPAGEHDQHGEHPK